MNRIEEKEAYLTLQCLWPKFSNNFYNSESPDLKNDVESIGIEVTQSTLDMRERIFYLADKMKVKPTEQHRKDLEVMVFYDKDNLYEDYEKSNEHKHTEKEMVYNTKELIKTKVTKFNNTYSKFNSNGLFVFIRAYKLSERAISEVCRYFAKIQCNYSMKMDLLFIHNMDELYVYDLSILKLSRIEIDDDTKNIIYNVL